MFFLTIILVPMFEYLNALYRFLFFILNSHYFKTAFRGLHKNG